MLTYLDYHIHEDPVPEGGDCDAAGGHLDPYGRTDDPACDDDSPETCEVGDLSGKNGPLEGSSADIRSDGASLLVPLTLQDALLQNPPIVGGSWV